MSGFSFDGEFRCLRELLGGSTAESGACKAKAFVDGIAAGAADLGVGMWAHLDTVKQFALMAGCCIASTYNTTKAKLAGVGGSGQHVLSAQAAEGLRAPAAGTLAKCAQRSLEKRRGSEFLERCLFLWLKGVK